MYFFISLTLENRDGFGMGFFRDPESRYRGFGIQIVHCDRDIKITKIPVKNPKYPEAPGIGI